MCHCHCREPTTSKELLATLQKQNGVMIPILDEDWATFPRTHMIVKRETLLEDALREARKSRFDPTKVFNVCAVYVL